MIINILIISIFTVYTLIFLVPVLSSPTAPAACLNGVWKNHRPIDIVQANLGLSPEISLLARIILACSKLKGVVLYLTCWSLFAGCGSNWPWTWIIAYWALLAWWAFNFSSNRVIKIMVSRTHFAQCLFFICSSFGACLTLFVHFFDSLNLDKLYLGWKIIADTIQIIFFISPFKLVISWRNLETLRDPLVAIYHSCINYLKHSINLKFQLSIYEPSILLLWAPIFELHTPILQKFIIICHIKLCVLIPGLISMPMGVLSNETLPRWPPALALVWKSLIESKGRICQIES